MDESQVFDPGLLRQLFEMGLMGIEIPEDERALIEAHPLGFGHPAVIAAALRTAATGAGLCCHSR